MPAVNSDQLPLLQHLTTLGVARRDARIYLHLLALGAAEIGQLAEHTGNPPDQVAAAIASLAEAGLVSRCAAEYDTVTPLPAGPAIDLLASKRDAELRRAKVAAINAFERAHRARATGTAEHLIEVIRGTSVRDRIYQVERAARTEVRAMESPPYYAAAEANQVELANLARGVHYRAVYARAALEQSDNLRANVLPSVKAGEQARTLPEVPVKLFVIDDSCAVVSMSDASTPVGTDPVVAMLIRPCSLLSAVVGLFEMCWRAALPLGIHDDNDAPPGVPYLQPSERRLLRLLAAGFSDEHSARVLGVSRRTIYRYLEGIMARTGAENRFQLAVHASRNGWI